MNLCLIHFLCQTAIQRFILLFLIMSVLVDFFKDGRLVGALAVAGSLAVLSLASRVSSCQWNKGDSQRYFLP